MNLSSSNQLIRSCPGSALVFGNSSCRQGSRNCGILVSGMGGSGEREEMGGKISLTRAKNGVFFIKEGKKWTE